MISLFIDTSSQDVSIALIKDNHILAQIVENIPNKHSIYTVSYIDKVLKTTNTEPSNINKIIVVNGPGSFTGIRIGVTIAKVFSYLEKIDTICISSLKMRAISTTGNYILSLIDAHHNNYYLGLYNNNYEEIITEGFYKEEDVLKIISKYNPIIVSDNDINNEKIISKKQELNILKIIDYYQNEKPINPHLINPNYLKLPQALEEAK